MLFECNSPQKTSCVFVLYLIEQYLPCTSLFLFLQQKGIIK